MKHRIHSHAHGDTAILASLKQELADVISDITVKPARGRATKLRNQFLRGIKVAGWSSETHVSRGSKMTITAAKQEIGLCLQTGNISRIYADLLKLQTMHLNKAIKAAIIVVPSRPTAKLLGDNIANADRLERELEIFQSAYSTPTIVFSLE